LNYIFRKNKNFLKTVKHVYHLMNIKDHKMRKTVFFKRSKNKFKVFCQLIKKAHCHTLILPGDYRLLIFASRFTVLNASYSVNR